MIYDENDEYQNIDEYGGNWKIVIDSELIDVYEYKEDAIDALIDELKILNNDNNISYMGDIDVFELVAMDYDSLYEFIDNVLDEINIDVDIKIICMNNDEPEFGELQY